MELRHLRYFAAVAEEQSFTKAADKLFTAQPSLSQQIKDLEEEVGVRLLDRSARQIQLTDEGRAFLPYALQAIENAKLAIAAARQVAHQKNNQIHIGLLNVAELKVLPLMLERLKQAIPNLQIHIQSLTCLEQIQRLKNAELDLSLTRYAIQQDDFVDLPILSEKIYLVSGQKSAPTKSRMSAEALLQQRLIMCEQTVSPVFYEQVTRQVPIEQMPAEQLLWVTNVLQHINLINLGMGYSFVPEYLLRFLDKHVAIIETDFEVQPLHLYANYRKNNHNLALQLITQELVKLEISVTES